MGKITGKKGASAIALATLCLYSGGALAQETSTTEAVFNEIVVTATKRAQSINDVPMSITAVSGEALANAGIKDVSDIARVAPGYTFTQTHDAIPVLTIRGVGYYDNNVAATPAVSAYVDEVPLPYPVMTAGAILDLERVEVLKGPQGTLFGQNSTGGALNFIAAKPKDSFEGELSLGYGRFDTIEATGYVTGPLGDTLKARLSGRFERGSDWQYSYTRDDSNGSVNRGGARLLLDWEPAAKFKAAVTLEGWYDKSEPRHGQLVGLELQAAGFQDPRLATGGGMFGPPLQQAYPNAPRDARAADWSPGIDYSADNRFLRASLRMEYDLSEALSLISITSYQDFEFDSPTDADATEVLAASLRNLSEINAFYQELRLQGDMGQVQWMIGGNYSKDTIDTNTFPQFPEWSIAGLASFFAGTNIPFNARLQNNQESEVWAIFGNLEYEISPGLILQGGARYTDHKQVQKGCLFDSGDGAGAAAFNAFPGPDLFGTGDCLVVDDATGLPIPIVVFPLNEDNISWRAGLSYEPNNDMLIYANVSKGYKSGAFTLPTGQIKSVFAPATQESLLAYEVGFKTGGRMFQFNGAAFYYDYRDKQLLAPFDFGPPFGVLDKLLNVPKSRVKGVELEAAVMPTNGMRLSINGTYLDTEVSSSFLTASPFASEGTIDLKGREFPFTPNFQIRTDASYQFPVSDNLDMFVNGALSFQSKSNARFGGKQLYELPSYALVDLSAGVESADGKYRVQIWGRNIFDTYYRIGVTTNNDTVFAIAGLPATYGIKGTVRF